LKGGSIAIALDRYVPLWRKEKELGLKFSVELMEFELLSLYLGFESFSKEKRAEKFLQGFS